MPRYIISREVTPVDGEDLLTIVSASNRRVRLEYVSIGGVGSSSASQGARVCNSTGGTTGSGALTPDPLDNPDQPAASEFMTVYTGWSAQPTVNSEGEELVWNAKGGKDRYAPPFGHGFEARNGANISIRADAAEAFQACRVTVVVNTG